MEVGEMASDLSCVAKERPFLLDRVYYTKRKTLERRDMTIALGMRCAGGLIIAADREMTSPDPGTLKYEEDKIYTLSGANWAAFLTYSNMPGGMKEAYSRIDKATAKSKTYKAIRGAVDNVLTSMGRQYIPLDFEMLIAIYVKGTGLELLKFDKSYLHPIDTFDVIGGGDSSLIRYLSDVLYSPNLTIADAENLAIYLISKAKDYIKGVGGGPDVFTLKANGSFQFSYGAEPSIRNKEKAMKDAEGEALRQILEAAKRAP